MRGSERSEEGRTRAWRSDGEAMAKPSNSSREKRDGTEMNEVQGCKIGESRFSSRSIVKC